MCLVLKLGDFDDQGDPLRNVWCKTNFELNTCSGLIKGEFGD